MNGTVDTAMNVGENSNARVLPIEETPPVAQNHVEQTDEDEIQDRGERFAQLVEYCNSPDGMMIKKINEITTHNDLTLLIPDVQIRPMTPS